jgi:hypothetical protein
MARRFIPERMKVARKQEIANGCNLWERLSSFTEGQDKHSENEAS